MTMIKRQRICPECHARGITTTFETGNKLRQHRRARHPKTTEQLIAERKTLKQYRTAAIIAAARGD